METFMSIVTYIRPAVWITIFAAVGTVSSETGVDPGNRYFWGENTGWCSGFSDDHGITVFFDGGGGWLAGHAWSENVGWIKLGADGGGPYGNTSAVNWGVNLTASGALAGLAWGENIGWINFAHPDCDASIDMESGNLTGHGWGENVGWLVLGSASGDFGLRTVAFDLQAMGTPNWWLDLYAVDEIFEEGDGFPAWIEFEMDTNPRNPNSYLRIIEVAHPAEGEIEVTFHPSSSRRYYTLIHGPDLSGDGWEKVPGQVAIPGTGGSQTLADGAYGDWSKTFYRIHVSLTP